MLFKAARRDRVISDDPSEFVKTAKRTQPTTRRPFTTEELQKVLAAADDEWQSLIRFGLYTGQRLGDLAALTWQNVDLERAELRITTQKTSKSLILPPPTSSRAPQRGGWKQSDNGADSPLRIRVLEAIRKDLNDFKPVRQPTGKGRSEKKETSQKICKCSGTRSWQQYGRPEFPLPASYGCQHDEGCGHTRGGRHGTGWPRQRTNERPLHARGARRLEKSCRIAACAVVSPSWAIRVAKGVRPPRSMVDGKPQKYPSSAQ